MRPCGSTSVGMKNVLGGWTRSGKGKREKTWWPMSSRSTKMNSPTVAMRSPELNALKSPPQIVPSSAQRIGVTIGRPSRRTHAGCTAARSSVRGRSTRPRCARGRHARPVGDSTERTASGTGARLPARRRAATPVSAGAAARRRMGYTARSRRGRRGRRLAGRSRRRRSLPANLMCRAPTLTIASVATPAGVSRMRANAGASGSVGVGALHRPRRERPALAGAPRRDRVPVVGVETRAC